MAEHTSHAWWTPTPGTPAAEREAARREAGRAGIAEARRILAAAAERRPDDEHDTAA